MEVLLQTGPALEQDRSTMQFVIIALLIVAALLGLLTLWYWKQTKPNKDQSTIAGSRAGASNRSRKNRPPAQETVSDRTDALQPIKSMGPATKPQSADKDPWTSLTSADPDAPGPS